MIKIEDDKFWYIDIDSIMNYVSNDITDDRYEEIEEIYDTKDNLVQRTVRDTAKKSDMVDIKFAAINRMLDILYTSATDTEGGGYKNIQDTSELGIGGKLIFNTMQQYGFIKDKLNKK